MAARGSLKNFFDNQMPDSRCPWGQLLPSASSAPLDMFGELCHRSSSSPSPSNHPPPPLPRQSDLDDSSALENFRELCYNEKASSSAQFPELLGHNERDPITAAATMEEENIGYMRSKSTQERSALEKLNNKDALYTRSYSDVRQRITGAGGRSVSNFPPPITTIGSAGKPRVYFKSFRKDGRFVLKEIKIPTQRLLHSTRHNGRLTMRVIQPEEEEQKKHEWRDEEEEEDR